MFILIFIILTTILIFSCKPQQEPPRANIRNNQSIPTSSSDTGVKFYPDEPDPGYETTEIGFLDRATYSITHFNPEKDSIAYLGYRTTRSGYVSIKLMRKNTEDFLLRTLVDCEWQDFGVYKIPWDGKDESGHFIDASKVKISFEGNFPDYRKEKSPGCKKLEIIPEQLEIRDEKRDLIRINYKIKNIHEKKDRTDYHLTFYIDYTKVGEQILKEDEDEFSHQWYIGNLPKGEHLLQVVIKDKKKRLGYASTLVERSL